MSVFPGVHPGPCPAFTLFSFCARTEKKATEWSKTRLTGLLTNIAVEGEGVGSARVHEVSAITGEATAKYAHDPRPSLPPSPLYFPMSWSIFSVTSLNSPKFPCSNRKAKLIFFYELVIKLKWKGETADGTAVQGTIDIPNLSEENEMDEIEVNVQLTSDRTAARDKVKDLLRTKGKLAIQDQLGKWLKVCPLPKAPGIPLIAGAAV